MERTSRPLTQKAQGLRACSAVAPGKSGRSLAAGSACATRLALRPTVRMPLLKGLPLMTLSATPLPLLLRAILRVSSVASDRPKLERPQPLPCRLSRRWVKLVTCAVVKRCAARQGPSVWLLDGPTPILNISKTDRNIRQGLSAKGARGLQQQGRSLPSFLRLAFRGAKHSTEWASIRFIRPEVSDAACLGNIRKATSLAYIYMRWHSGGDLGRGLRCIKQNQPMVQESWNKG